ncbi:hypothetical protein G6F24_018915 [Rhizopus arrhizus]|nr:hypothetical protein G6F24_018915 [Rhizopus arrhizus]
MHQRPGQRLLHRVGREAQLLADLGVGQAVDLRHQEDAAACHGQAVQQFANLFQRFQDQGARLHRRLYRHRLQRQRFGIGRLQRRPPRTADQ